MQESAIIVATRQTDQGREPARLAVPEEVPVELRYNGTAYATMMASPTDLEDFALGFSLTEAIAQDVTSLGGLSISHAEEGVVVDVRLAGADYAALLRDGQQAGQRAIPGRTGCGICGVRTLEEARRALPASPPGADIGLDAIRDALDALDRKALAKGTHGAAFCTPDGAMVLMRVDVGRHNALDKLIGALLRGQQTHDVADGFCLITSRCSYEMVQKAVRAGFATLVALSSPTGLALRTAQKAGLTVIALARRDGCYVFQAPSEESGENLREVAL